MSENAPTLAEWKEIFKHNNDPIQRTEVDGVTYLGIYGVFRKVDNGQVFDMNPQTKKWDLNKILSLEKTQ